MEKKKVVLPEVNMAAKQMNTKIIDTLDILNAETELNHSLNSSYV